MGRPKKTRQVVTTKQVLKGSKKKKNDGKGVQSQNRRSPDNNADTEFCATKKPETAVINKSIQYINEPDSPGDEWCATLQEFQDGNIVTDTFDYQVSAVCKLLTQSKLEIELIIK